MFKKMLSAFSVGALALSLLFVKEAKADQVTEGRPAPEDTTDQGTNTQAVSAVNKAEVDAAKDSLDQKNEQVKEEETAVKEAEKHKDADDKDELEAAIKALQDAIMPIGAKMYQQAAEDNKADKSADDKKSDKDEPVEGEVVDKK